MNKKIISLLLVLSMVLSLIPKLPVKAAMSEEKPEYILGEFEYRFEGPEEPIHRVQALLWDNLDIYASVEDIAFMAGFEVLHGDGKYVFFRPYEKIWTYLNLSMDEDGVCFNEEEVVPFYDIKDGERLYGMIHLLRYLRAQFILDDSKEDDVAVICQAEAKTLFDVWEEFGQMIENAQLSQQDLFISHGQLATYSRSTLAVLLDGGFDYRVIIPIWGDDIVVRDEYKKALLTLTGEDSNYLADGNESEVQEIIDQLHFQLDPKWISEVSGFLGESGDVMEILENAKNLPRFAQKLLGTQIKFSEKAMKVALGMDIAGMAVDGFTVTIETVYNCLDIAQRSEGWKDSFIKGLEILEDTNKTLFTKGSGNSVDLIKDASSSLLREHKEPIMAAVAEGAGGVVGFLFKMIATNSFPMGAMIGILDACLGMGDVLLDGMIDEGTTTYLVDCLLDISVVARRNLQYEISQAILEAREKGYFSQERLDKIRALMILTLRVTQRSYAYVYALETANDPQYAESRNALEDRRVMYTCLALMSIVSESEAFDTTLVSLHESTLLSEEDLQIRDDLSESIWRTAWFGGDIVDAETGKPITNAKVVITREDAGNQGQGGTLENLGNAGKVKNSGNAGDRMSAIIPVDANGHWETQLDNRYDWQIEITGEDEEGEEYSSVTSVASKGDIDQEENYLYYDTVLSKENEELFYAYLRENVVPKIGVCDGASFTTKLDNKEMEANGGTGLLSALVDDLDNDGQLEMVTVTVSVKDGTEDMLVSLVFGTGRPTVSLDLDLYELEDGKVVHKDGPKNIGYMERKSYGATGVSVSQWEGITYFIGDSTMDDETTYGPHAVAIYHAEEGKLVFDYVGGGSWGQGLPGDDNAKMNTRNVDFTNTSIGAGFTETLSHIDFEYEFNKNGSNVNVTITDYSLMKEALDDSYQVIRDRAKAFLKLLDDNQKTAEKTIAEKILKEEEAKNSSAGKTAREVCDYIMETSGIELELTRESVSDDGSYSVSLKTKDKAQIYLVVNKEGVITRIRTEARYYQQTEEWIALKDAVVSLPQLGLSSDSVSSFSGTLSVNSADETSNGYRILIYNIDNFTIEISLNE